MSQMAYHWEALRKQRVIDKRVDARKKEAEEQAHAEALRTEAAARQQAEQQRIESSRQRLMKEQVDNKDWASLKKTNKERNREIDRLLRENSWHNDLVARMEQEEKDRLLMELLNDHKHKEKVLRDHGLYRGHSSQFTDPKYQ